MFVASLPCNQGSLQGFEEEGRLAGGTKPCWPEGGRQRHRHQARCSTRNQRLAASDTSQRDGDTAHVLRRQGAPCHKEVEP